jgi:hypothetical protein
MGQAKKAARSIHKYLTGSEPPGYVEPPPPEADDQAEKKAASGG